MGKPRASLHQSFIEESYILVTLDSNKLARNHSSSRQRNQTALHSSQRENSKHATNFVKNICGSKVLGLKNKGRNKNKKMAYRFVRSRIISAERTIVAYIKLIQGLYSANVVMIYISIKSEVFWPQGCFHPGVDHRSMTWAEILKTDEDRNGLLL
ncbi:hypothetical protein C0J52_07774 [Blattella germanica]|nr:hypothetical protein C0J52_07774 [Blattella germanica]